MSNFKLTSNEKESGKVAYNVRILYNIVALAVAEVEGTVQNTLGKKNGISLFVEKDGVYVDVSVTVKYGYNIPELAYRIQQNVKQSVENMTNYKVAEVDVHVLDVTFDEEAPIEKIMQDEEEEESDDVEFDSEEEEE
jgi:uncharacterized alkaline shock family protein YloU